MGENPAQRADEVAALQAGLECGLQLIDTAEMSFGALSEGIADTRPD